MPAHNQHAVNAVNSLLVERFLLSGEPEPRVEEDYRKLAEDIVEELEKEGCVVQRVENYLVQADAAEREMREALRRGPTSGPGWPE